MTAVVTIVALWLGYWLLAALVLFLAAFVATTVYDAVRPRKIQTVMPKRLRCRHARDTMEPWCGHLGYRCMDCGRWRALGPVFPSQYCHSLRRAS